MANAGETLSEEDLDRQYITILTLNFSMISAADVDKDGRVNLQEFLKMMK